jgi:23S rRNA (cytosine1962-C5)-methyltransferase
MSNEIGAAAATLPEVVLRERRAQPFFGRHPWVFAGAIDRINPGSEGTPTAASIVRLISAQGQFVATGLFNSVSRIQVRLYSWQPDEVLNAEFWDRKILSAINSRKSRFDLSNPLTGCRIIFSESDQLSGLTVDLYGGFLLVQFTSLALYAHRTPILDSLQKHLKPRGVWLRTEKGMREAEGLEVVDGLISGEEPPRPLFIEEHGIRYGVDVQQGQKTGCYLDQRENRIFASRYMKAAKVLDAFCFSGGFGIAAVRHGGAASVVGLDSSESAITLATANAELNEVSNRCQWKKSDVRVALEEMAGEGTLFDVVCIDPPRMARTRGGLERALNGYLRLNLQAIRVLRAGGTLVTCSCSGLVSRSEFQEMLAEAARQSGRDIQILESHGQPSDHPVSVTCPETEYLKMFICRVS